MGDTPKTKTKIMALANAKGYAFKDAEEGLHELIRADLVDLRPDGRWERGTPAKPDNTTG